MKKTQNKTSPEVLTLTTADLRYPHMASFKKFLIEDFRIDRQAFYGAEVVVFRNAQGCLWLLKNRHGALGDVGLRQLKDMGILPGKKSMKSVGVVEITISGPPRSGKNAFAFAIQSICREHGVKCEVVGGDSVRHLEHYWPKAFQIICGHGAVRIQVQH